MYVVVSVTKSRAEHNDETVVMFAEKIHCSDLINRQPSLPLPPYFNAACFLELRTIWQNQANSPDQH